MPDFQRTTRPEMEALWHERVRAARGRYCAASAKHHEALEERQQSLIPGVDGTHAIRQAAKVEAMARQEYMRVLRIFTALVVEGEVPPQD
jgi:hypothetical protein